ncbi:Queuine tRNA-ribosyltransferase catalytic subunit 1 [Dictyocoela muelleri]|nr:Queuine tRNA-ribosyltransferase catalytic subunit 1 [Dictyocoela muelleri]
MFKIIKKCKTTKARISELTLFHGKALLPTFMPVATKGCMKGVLLHHFDHQIILSNTYHMREMMNSLENLMKYHKPMLTDSGGFQIGSLNPKVTEEGVHFDDVLLTPEKSIEIQNRLGADIIMQLDHVVNPKLETRESMERSVRWLDRCIKFHKNNNQLLFPIIQGGTNLAYREESVREILKRNPKGVAIGGLSGGEDKKLFAETINFTTNLLPENIPRYVMGIGYPEDIIICIALGCDMSDCVYPTRTARFGTAMTDSGNLNLTKNKFSTNLTKIDNDCECSTCQKYTRAFIYSLKGTSNFCTLLTIHNLFYMKNLLERIRTAIQEDRFPEFIKTFFEKRFRIVPSWIIFALKLVGVNLGTTEFNK